RLHGGGWQPPPDDHPSVSMVGPCTDRPPGHLVSGARRGGAKRWRFTNASNPSPSQPGIIAPPRPRVQLRPAPRPTKRSGTSVRRWPKYSEAVIWGNSRCFFIQETLPKALFFGKVRSEKAR